MRVNTLMRRVGAEYSSERFFKRDLKHVLDNFAARGWIRGYKFTLSNSEGEELLEIDKVQTPSQVRANARQLVAV